MRETAIGALISVMFCASCSHEAADNSGYVPFPSGFGYMDKLSALQKATDQGDKAVLRDHAWNMWAGIMQPDNQTGWPLWYSWRNTTAAFTAAATDPTLKPAEPFVAKSLRAHNLDNSPSVSTQTPIYCVPSEVQAAYPTAISLDSNNQPVIGDGQNFQNNGDIMIATESLSKEAYESIRNQKLYLQSTLDKNYKDKKDVDIAQRAIVTKHMYWPVKANGLTALPVWKNQIKPSDPSYAGYEIWDSLVAIDPTGKHVGKKEAVAFLYGVRQYQKDWYCPSDSAKPAGAPAMMPTVKKRATVYGLNDFYFHRVTKADWASFNDNDKAIINASSYWANNQAFKVGDYLVTVAMHVNTKELPSWTLQLSLIHISEPTRPY